MLTTRPIAAITASAIHTTAIAESTFLPNAIATTAIAFTS
jgi:hypothetical protein